MVGYVSKQLKFVDDKLRNLDNDKPIDVAAKQEILYILEILNDTLDGLIGELDETTRQSFLKQVDLGFEE